MNSCTCECCGRRFAAPAYHRESRGEAFGLAAYEMVAGCPYCGGTYQVETDTKSIADNEHELSSM